MPIDSHSSGPEKKEKRDLPSWTSWQRLDEELPKWDNWLATAGEPAPAPPPPGPRDDGAAGVRNETRKGIRLGAPAPAPPAESAPEAAPESAPRYRHVPLQGDGGTNPPAFHALTPESPPIAGDGDELPPAPPVPPDPAPPAGFRFFDAGEIEGDGFTGVEFHAPRPFAEPAPPPFAEPTPRPEPAWQPEPPRPAPPTPPAGGLRVAEPHVAEVRVAEARVAGPAQEPGELDAPSFYFEQAAAIEQIVVRPAAKPKVEPEPHVLAPVTESFSAIDLRDRVVIMLLFKQVVRIEQVEAVWPKWQKMVAEGSKEPLWRVLAQEPGLDRDNIFAEAAQVYAFKEAHLNRAAALKYIRDQKGAFSEALWERMRRLHVIPVAEEKLPQGKEKRLLFVAYDPTRTEVHRLLKDLKLDSYELQYLPEPDIEGLIAEAFPKKNEFLERMTEDPMAFDLGTSYEQGGRELIDEDALEAEINRSSLINLFEASLVEAVRQGASDIHIFPNMRKQVEIHFRVDGELNRWHVEERVHPEAFLAVVKDNATSVDRFERDAAQDGFIQRWVDDALIRYRVSVLPIANANQELRAESIVIRVLDDRKVITDLRRLGLLDRALDRFEHAIRQPHGMVILTGPTGSGKSTTLFAALNQVVTPRRNVLTVEDPVEYIIPGVRQIKLNHKLGLEQAIRAILRHDPDIVMVGEMRDRPTAELAIKLANTGHLTFSTLHTNDAPSAVSRLYKMGVEPFLIAYAINLVVAQRLIRKLCPSCRRVERGFDPEMLRRLGFTDHEIHTTTFFEEGNNPRCPECKGAGYKGRRAITETMPFTKEIRRLIVTSNEMIDEDAIREVAVREGMLTLRDSAREYVRRGETSVMEMIRVTAGEE